MTSERSQAYGRVTKLVDDFSASKLHASEQQTIRDAADALFFCEDLTADPDARAALDAVEAALRPGRTAGEVFEAHARALDGRGLAAHRLNACGYSLGARYAPSWMDWPMFYRDNPAVLAPDMVFFAHMILMDSDAGAAVTLGRSYRITEGAPESLSRASLDLPVR